MRQVRVCVIEAKGSTPREVGAAMIVSKGDLTGTIGGGALEHEAIDCAEKMLDGALWDRTTKAYPLGPSLGQCCGGFTRVMYEVFDDCELDARDGALVLRKLECGVAPVIIRDRHDRGDDWPLALNRTVQDMMSGAVPPAPVLIADEWYVEPVIPVRQTLFLYGAGHVGRAVVQAMAGLPFEIMWVDTGADRYPDTIPDNATAVPATNPATIATHAPANAFHVVMTYSHALDFSICQTVLDRGQFGYLGVIGSKTKRERFTRRLRDCGIPDSAVSRMACPIGLKGLNGKEPAVIAISIAADLLQRQSTARYVSDTVQTGGNISL
jgi:xanthine dehydrogenase accessory factor